MTTKEYKNFVLEKLSIDNITYKPMMGEYLLYYKNVLIGGIYDNRLLIKITGSNKKYNLKENIPYAGAKPMYLIENNDDIKLLNSIILDTYNDLKNKFGKKIKKIS